MNIRSFVFCLLFLSGLFFACDKKSGEKSELYESADSGKASGESASADSASAAVTEITFEETEYDFGKLNDGEMASHIFKFKNTGKAPLVISDVRADCGCTVPTWTKEPVMPGEEDKIEVKYNSTGRGGQTITKTVTVLANTEPSDTKLIIHADVKAKGASPKKGE